MGSQVSLLGERGQIGQVEDGQEAGVNLEIAGIEQRRPGKEREQQQRQQVDAVAGCNGLRIATDRCCNRWPVEEVTVQMAVYYSTRGNWSQSRQPGVSSDQSSKPAGQFTVKSM